MQTQMAGEGAVFPMLKGCKGALGGVLGVPGGLVEENDFRRARRGIDGILFVLEPECSFSSSFRLLRSKNSS